MKAKEQTNKPAKDKAEPAKVPTQQLSTLTTDLKNTSMGFLASKFELSQISYGEAVDNGLESMIVAKTLIDCLLQET